LTATDIWSYIRLSEIHSFIWVVVSCANIFFLIAFDALAPEHLATATQTYDSSHKNLIAYAACICQEFKGGFSPCSPFYRISHKGHDSLSVPGGFGLPMQ